MIYLGFNGGLDSFNMLVPHTCSKGPAYDLYQQYVDVRKTVALPRESLLPLDATASDQPCEVFGVHAKLTNLAQLYQEGDALFVANIGVLTKPTDKVQYESDERTQLFDHEKQRQEAEEADPFNHAPGTGVLGRLNDVLGRKGYRTEAIAVDTHSVSVVGQNPEVLVVGQNGLTKFNPIPSTNETYMLEAVRELNGATTADSGYFAETWASHLVDSLAKNADLYQALLGINNTNVFPTTSIGKQLSMIARLMKLDRATDRDIFFVEMGGFDNHASLNANLNTLFDQFNAALGPFVKELKDHGLWDSTVVVEMSDFARTLDPNSGAGTDHGWGGNTFMLGGQVRGGVVKGQYPDNLTDNGRDMLSRGRAVPVVPFDAVWHSVARWAGADASEMIEILPNMGHFDVADGALFEACDLFHTACSKAPSTVVQWESRNEVSL